MSQQQTINEKTLRDRFNPEGSLLRRHQQRMLEMLRAFDTICQRHHIPYWLSSGTLLGCVRHGGFIPWDDDLDVEMLREDYLRLQPFLLRELPDHLALQTHQTDPGYFFCYPKLRDRRSHLEELSGYDWAFGLQGAYIDIFLLESSPACLQTLSQLTIGHCYAIMKDRHLSPAQKRKRVGRWFRANQTFVFPVLRLLSRLSSRRWLRHTFGTPYPAPRQRSDIFPLAERTFEGHAFPVPRDNHAYLQRMFGDYMKLPNLDRLQVHTAKLKLDE
ncbi:MAG: LicD family protein [Bacteroidales bacterium]|nr:LicD family protein [Candidatus Physcousia equi]